MFSLENTKVKMDKVSPTFCLAKWLQVTLHLHFGHNHSCHHPDTHRIDSDEIKKNPAALHNTAHKRELKSQMLKGQRPKECSYCWKVEDSPGGSFSDRIYKSSANWALPFIDEVVEKGASADIVPRYLEVSFSHACNFKCSYCGPHFSSAWEKEIKDYGHYQLSRPHNDFLYLAAKGKVPLPLNEPNPYVEAFWQWWPIIHAKLKVLRVTGGEPLLSPDTFKLIDQLIKKPCPNLDFAINTNLGVPKKTLDKLIEKLKRVQLKREVKQLQLFTSVDTWGSQAAYIRHGLDFDKFWANLERVLIELPQASIIIMCTFNSLSVPQFKKLLKEVLKLRRKTKAFRHKDSHFTLCVSHLSNPQHQSILALPKDFLLLHLNDCLAFIESNMAKGGKWGEVGFSSYERDLFKRLIDYSNHNEPEDLIKAQSDFYRFFSEHDRRRGSNFRTVFPELDFYWKQCKESEQIYNREVSSRFKSYLYSKSSLLDKFFWKRLRGAKATRSQKV